MIRSFHDFSKRSTRSRSLPHRGVFMDLKGGGAVVLSSRSSELVDFVDFGDFGGNLF